MTEILTALLVLAGGLFALVAAIGILRLPDVLIRMHASTKAGTLGCGLILMAVAVHFAESGIIARAVLAIIFLLLTAPVGAHLIGRAAYRMGVPLWQRTAIDELASDRKAAAASGKPSSHAPP
ncbi:MAG: monovalent cation/H(+) antiporter subunit G [Alphaproteobacteria bacterium]|nr:monovalent cation/H(+) antiporter subunit G [Alphaproteobacteria bacterium]MCY4231368.1 monovalent cation/H(+) antiporter subunit G [Alphaproteobacteria bacterium]MCY4320283.1 monovalent cation/H(+) antiporter subunit G [Alphaproteobacteria bacterium]